MCSSDLLDTSQNIDNFFNDWFKKQKYILDEFDTIKFIIDSVIHDYDLKWSKLSIVGEAILQARLLRLGRSLSFFNVEEFPTNTKDFKKLIKKA